MTLPGLVFFGKIFSFELCARYNLCRKHYIMRPIQIWDLEKISNDGSNYDPPGTCNFFRNVVLCVRHNPCLKHYIMRPIQTQTLRKNLGPQNPDLRKKTS